MRDLRTNGLVGWRVIRVARGEANRLFVRRRNRRGRAGPSSHCRFRASLEAMDSFEMNKILGAILGTCLGVAAHQHCRRSDLRAAKPAKPGYEIAVPEQAAGAEPPSRPEPQVADRATARQGRCRPRRERGQEMRGLPHLQQGREPPGRSQPVGRGRPCEGVGGGLQLFGRAEGQGRQLDHRRPQPVHRQSAGAMFPAPT